MPLPATQNGGWKSFDDDLYRGLHFVFFTFGLVNGDIGLKGKQRIRPITFTIQADSEGLPYNYPDYYLQRSY